MLLFMLPDWETANDFHPQDTDTVKDFEENEFLDLRKPLLRQVWEAKFRYISRRFYCIPYPHWLQQSLLPPASSSTTSSSKVCSSLWSRHPWSTCIPLEIIRRTANPMLAYDTYRLVCCASLLGANRRISFPSVPSTVHLAPPEFLREPRVAPRRIDRSSVRFCR